MNKNFILLLSMTALLFGCSVPATPSQAPIASPTEVFPTLTSTPLPPTATEKPATSTLTPETTLRTQGPYFAYFRQVDGVYQLVMMDADGGGRKVNHLPQGFVDSLTNQQYGLNMKFVSPNGKWLAFYTGSAGSNNGAMLPQGTYDLTLNLLNLITGEKQVITPLLSKDYPQNFSEAEKQLNQPDLITALSLQEAFLNGITNAIGWSPNGQYLAFAGQMDGLSSDLYVYDMEKKTIHRLTSGAEELEWIDWSSDGKWILHGSTAYIGEGSAESIYAATADGSSIHDFPYGHVGDWLNSHEFFEFDSQNGPGNYGLRLIDIDTGKITNIWDGAFRVYGVDQSKQWLVLTAFTSDKSPYLIQNEDPSFRQGLQLINLNSLHKTQVIYPPDEFVLDYEITALKSSHQIFFLSNKNLAYDFYLSDKGEVTPVDVGNAKVSFSPSSEYWTAITNQDIKIFSVDASPIKTIPISTLDTNVNVEWRPDSSGSFLVDGTNIYALDISQGTVNLIETNLLDIFGVTYKWIDGQ